MHPLLATKGRIALYLLIWIPLSALLGYLLAMQGKLTWSEAGSLAVPLGLFYSFVCLAPWYVCRVLPLGGRRSQRGDRRLVPSILCSQKMAG